MRKNTILYIIELQTHVEFYNVIFSFFILAHIVTIF